MKEENVKLVMWAEDTSRRGGGMERVKKGKYSQYLYEDRTLKLLKSF
jgi:hypothetical protein